MDPLTHTLTGAALADALSMSRTSGRRGLLFAMFMGAAPDLDLLPAFIAKLPHNLIPGQVLFDSRWMGLHRGLTHSLCFALVFGLVAGWVFWRLNGKDGSAWRWPLLAAVALLSHALLDLPNGGVAFWLPFSDAWASWVDLPVVDPLTLGILAACYVANHPPRTLWRRCRAEGAFEQAWRTVHNHADNRYGIENIARIALALVTLGVIVRV